MVATAARVRARGGLAAIEPVEPPGLIKGGDGHDEADGGRRAATAVESSCWSRREISMLASSRFWFAVLPG
jgi:hypothetical protein